MFNLRVVVVHPEMNKLTLRRQGRGSKRPLLNFTEETGIEDLPISMLVTPA